MRRSARRVAGAIALGCVLCLAPPARADQQDYGPDGVPEDSIAPLLPAGGDPFGHRRWLAERGIAFNLWYRNDTLANTQGGRRRGVVNQGLLETSLQVDLGRLAGLEGLRFFSNQFAIHNTGRIRRDYVGGINTIAAIEAVPTFRLSEAWLEQSLFGGVVRLRAGQLAADVDFFYSAASALFLQSDFATISALNLPSGGPAYPLATPGLFLAVEPNAAVTLQFGLYNGDPAGRGPGDEQVRNRRGTDFRMRDPALVFAEAQFRANQEEGLARTVKLGAWGHLGGFDHQRLGDDRRLLADPAGSGQPLRRRGNSGVYGVLDQQLWRPAGGSEDSGITAYARVSAAPQPDRSVIGIHLDGGLVFAGLVPGRAEDRFGLGFLYARYSDAARDFDRDRNRLTGEAGPVRGHEANLELTYQAAIMQGWSVQPAVTHVWNPGGVPGRNALVAGLRTQLRF